MTCLQFQKPTLPMVPDIFLPPFTIVAPVVGFNFCCPYAIPIPGLAAAIQEVNAAFAAAEGAVSAEVQAIIIPLNSAIAFAQQYLDLILLAIPDCPLDLVADAASNVVSS